VTRAVVRAAVAILAVAACGPAAPDWRVQDENGLAWRLIHCRRKADCMDRASAICPDGYVDRHDLKNSHEMMVRCKGTDWSALK